ncbi:TlpA family protein disulfide reductase [Polaribacter gangjinensis]|uniref:Thioredoxin domain-containing protein n=1 Tax=Polaribacter gangjinensis TaxID=574710 RepID=A0A2S7WAT3_9FLAO|nr:TlpA disulfide reductase family protein [Polaribacter gangjinensis]PQJ74697.1 hypothetical protein BTO13_05245 [Polaribacter gangjinensis]
MKIRIVVVFLVFILSCNKGNENHKSIEKVKIEKPKDEVYLSLNNSSSPISINVISEKDQVKPDLISLGNQEKSNEIVIPTDSILDIVIGNKFYVAKAQFKKGDSVLISMKDFKQNKRIQKFPFFFIKNRNEYELNFDFYVISKTPTRNSYKIHLMNSIFDKKLHKFTIAEVEKNTKNTADSLLSKKLISKDFYENEIFELEYYKENFLLEEALKTKTKYLEINLKKIIDTKKLSSNSNYITYLINSVRYKHFFNEGLYVKDAKVLQFLLENRPFKFDNKLEYLVNDKLLSSIYLYERKNLDYLLESLIKSNQFVLNKKYKNIIAKENEEITSKRNLKSLNVELLQFDETNQVLTSFDEIIKSNKGNLLLIDFWASWCAPCRNQMPNLRLIKKELENSNFSIISISIDEKISSWKKAVKQEKLLENSFLLLNHKESEIVKKYKIETIPRYMLFDKNGILISDNAPIPSDEILKKIILENLN